CGEWEGADSPEELMAGAAALDCELAGRAGELRDVGAGGEDERLSRDDERRPVAVLELRQQLLQRLERRPPEEGRLRVVLAVVDRDQRNALTVPLDLRQLELSLRQEGSPRSAPRPCPSRRRARSI